VRTLTYLVELLVGLACLAGVVPLWRRAGAARIASAVLAAAGVAAVIHGVAELAR
jgi:hypothetical protein